MGSTYSLDTSIKLDFINMFWNPNQPYDALPPLPPHVELETPRVLKQCIRSRTALEQVNQSADFLPNKELLINIMPLLEARASSEIENIVTTTDRLFRSSVAEKQAIDLATKEALSYRKALNAGFESIKHRPLCTNTAEEICSTIKQTEMHLRMVPGTTLRNDRTGDTIYTPPVGEHVIRKKLSNWEKFIHHPGDLDPLVVMAAAHYQFEANHPFTDGNGRTGRIINLLLLISLGLLKSPILYHSRGIIRRKDEYYSNLLNVTHSDSAESWETWILYMLEVIEESALWTYHKINSIRKMRRETKTWLKKNHANIYSAELLVVLFNQPYCRIADVVEGGIAKRQAASTYLKQLVDSGLLIEEKVGREKLFIHQKLLMLLLDESDPPPES